MAKELEEEVSEIANSLLGGKASIKLLEAGCGSASHIAFNMPVHTVGIDISQEELDLNTTVQEKILGDIQNYPLPKEHFDVVVCWTVLEHLPRPKDALLNLLGSTKPGGLLILGIPNLLSIKGVVTKFTPFWFHRSFYAFMGYRTLPFPTYLRAAIIPGRLIRLMKDNGAAVPFYRSVEGRVTRIVRSRYRSIDIAFSVLDVILKGISFGKLQPLLDNSALIVQKPG